MGEAMADRRGLMAFDSSEEATETSVGLLVGDLQIRRAIGEQASEALFDARVQAVQIRLFLMLRHSFWKRVWWIVTGRF